ncbi:hypothetical protein COOONC_22135, partial [Cooperia oncophora]
MRSCVLLPLFVIMMVHHRGSRAGTRGNSDIGSHNNDATHNLRHRLPQEAATTTEPTTTTVAPQPNNRICPANSGMVDATRVQAKSAHNYRRGRLARGEVK